VLFRQHDLRDGRFTMDFAFGSGGA